MKHSSRLAVLVLACLATCGEAQVLPRVTNARCVCCLKDYGYASERLSAPVTAVSFDALPRQTSTTLAGETGRYATTEIKSFPLRQSRLVNDHCELRDVVFVGRQDGTWTLSFRARQDINLIAEPQRPRFVRFQQNRFVVNVRLVIVDQLENSSETAGVAAPVAGTIPAAHFWLPRGGEENLTFAGCSDELKSHFPLVRRVEVDLQYE